ncbi:hypothetical protein [Burkholderia cenocepacia]|jgi:hypothetical protein|uniref:hypothetical protein n=1 Tax=Burkholderia cenocepacia TaxID=95486 RepID=UPI000F5BFE9F|nr:hypothetical protein [Burkholderia cenocepacia]
MSTAGNLPSRSKTAAPASFGTRVSAVLRSVWASYTRYAQVEATMIAGRTLATLRDKTWS